MKKIGLIGLGNMGGGMALNLLEAGFTLTIYDINEDTCTPLQGDTCNVASSPAEVGKNSEIVITSLPSPESFVESCCGESGLLENMAPGSFIIDMSTIDPVTTREIHELAMQKNIHTLDAPVSGGPQGARTGTLSIMVGGRKEDFEALKFLFDVLGQNVNYLGDIGSGQMVKLCNNAIAATHTAVLGEVMLTGVKVGLDLETMSNVFKASAGDCWILRNFFPKTVFKNKYEPPLFSINLMVKDLDLYLRTAKATGITNVLASTTFQFYNSAKALGNGNKDHTSVVQVAETMSNYKLGTIPDPTEE